MNIPQPLIEAYGRLASVLDVVEHRVAQTLTIYAKDNLLPVVGRKKTIESLAEKIETGRYTAFNKIDDLVAFTLIVPGLHQEAEAINYCKSAFGIFHVKTRGAARKAPESFQFDATRLYGRLQKPAGSDVGGEPSIFDIIFEIQIRTAFEHAWIVSTHPLTYKAARIDWKRYRLAAQLKAGVEQLDLSVLQFEALSAAIPESPWADITDMQAVDGLIDKLIDAGVIPREAGPKDMSRFADNFLALFRSSKKKAALDIALAKLEASLMEFNIDTFPRSASLLQVCMALLFQNGLLSGPLQRYACHVTPQLGAIFPGIEGLTPVFRYSNEEEQRG